MQKYVFASARPWHMRVPMRSASSSGLLGVRQDGVHAKGT